MGGPPWRQGAPLRGSARAVRCRARYPPPLTWAAVSGQALGGGRGLRCRVVSEGPGRRARGPASSSRPRRRTEEGKEAARPCSPRGRLLCEPSPFPTRESGRREECVAALPAEPTAGWRAAPLHGTARCRSAAEDAPGGARGCLGGHRLRRAAGTVPAAGRRSADRGVREARKRLEASRAGRAGAGRAAWLSVLRVRVDRVSSARRCCGGTGRCTAGAAALGPAGREPR